MMDVVTFNRLHGIIAGLVVLGLDVDILHFVSGMVHEGVDNTLNGEHHEESGAHDALGEREFLLGEEDLFFLQILDLFFYLKSED